MKHLACFILLALISCQNSIRLTDKEQALVGSWKYSFRNGPAVGSYMEFHDDRTGTFGLAMENEETVKLARGLSFDIKDWRIQNDTLIIQFKSMPGLVFYGPDGKEVKPKEGPSLARYIVWETSDNAIVLEDLVAEFPGKKDRYERSEKIGL